MNKFDQLFSIKIVANRTSMNKASENAISLYTYGHWTSLIFLIFISLIGHKWHIVLFAFS